MNAQINLLATTAIALLLFSLSCSSSKDGALADTAPPAQDIAPELTADLTPEVTQDLAAPDPDLVESTDLPVDTGPAAPGPAAPKPYSGKVCPVMKSGKNSFQSAKRPRAVQLYLPAQPQGAPVVFIWHGLGDSPTNMGAFFQADKIAQQYGAIVAIPHECCDTGADCCDNLMVWNYGDFSHLDADSGLFDDTLSCLDQQFDIDNSRVYVTGFSAGSLFGSWLVMNRAEYLAAAAIFSGGCGTVVTCNTPEYNLPAIIAWGGKEDVYVIVSFEDEGKKLSQNLQDIGSFVIECNHGQGHTIPWGASTWAVDFLMAHTWSNGSSSYAKTGVPDDWPDYCYVP